MDYIGSLISLISKSDIRYVGILHNINGEDSTISLQQVRSFGTEGRKGNATQEIPPSDNVFEFIVFRGSDVKDLRIEEKPHKYQVPNDPAILNVSNGFFFYFCQRFYDENYRMPILNIFVEFRCLPSDCLFFPLD